MCTCVACSGTWVYVCTSVHMCVWVQVHVCANVCACSSTWVCARVCMQMYGCRHVYMCARVISHLVIIHLSSSVDLRSLMAPIIVDFSVLPWGSCAKNSIMRETQREARVTP